LVPWIAIAGGGAGSVRIGHADRSLPVGRRAAAPLAGAAPAAPPSG
jgi:hypothetical protein